MADRYLLAADLEGILDGTHLPVRLSGYSGFVSQERMLCYDQRTHRLGTVHADETVEIDLHDERTQREICLRWGPAHDARGARSWGETGRCEEYWISLLGSPDRIASEVRAVLKDLEARHG